MWQLSWTKSGDQRSSLFVRESWVASVLYRRKDASCCVTLRRIPPRHCAGPCEYSAGKTEGRRKDGMHGYNPKGSKDWRGKKEGSSAMALSTEDSHLFFHRAAGLWRVSVQVRRWFRPRIVRDGEPRTSTSSFTQLSSERWGFRITFQRVGKTEGKKKTGCASVQNGRNDWRRKERRLGGVGMTEGEKKEDGMGRNDRGGKERRSDG